MLAVSAPSLASMRVAVPPSSRNSSISSPTVAVSPGVVTSFGTSSLSFSEASTSALNVNENGQGLPKTMLVTDKIYGSFTVTEPVLIDLLHSEPIDRLRSVLQHGITGLIGLTPSPAVTRYEHSVGAMLLVRAAGGSVEAQASALLHDVAHTALSHVVDGVFGYVVHEDDKMEYLENTTIPSILTKHNHNADEILEEANFPLLELDAPAICADRLDYGIRDSLSFGFLSLEEASAIQKDLRVSEKGTFCFRSRKWANKLCRAYIESDEFAWSNEVHSVLYRLAADTIRLAHDSKLMAKSELWEGGDESFWARMTSSSSSEIRTLASKVHPNIQVQEISSSEFIEGQDMKWTAKIRTLDPDVLCEGAAGERGETRRLTEVDQEYRMFRDGYLKRKEGERCWRVMKQ